VTSDPLTFAISPEPDGVRDTTSPGARIAAFPEASLRETEINAPLVPVVVEVVFFAAKVTEATPDETLMVKTLYDSEPESDASEDATAVLVVPTTAA